MLIFTIGAGWFTTKGDDVEVAIIILNVPPKRPVIEKVGGVLTVTGLPKLVQVPFGSWFCNWYVKLVVASVVKSHVATPPLHAIGVTSKDKESIIFLAVIVLTENKKQIK